MGRTEPGVDPAGMASPRPASRPGPRPEWWGQLGLVISDVDGTILNEAKALTPETVAAVRRLAAVAVPITLLSARPPSGLAPLVAELGIVMAHGAFNGGTIVGPDGSILLAERLDHAAGQAIAEMVGASGAGTWVFADGQWFASDLAHRLIARERRSSFIDPLPLAALGDGIARIDKLVAVCDDPALAERLEHEGQARFGTMAQVSRSQPFYCDFTHRLAEKGRGAAMLARLAGVPMDRTATFGDGYNDIAMLDAAGASFAMGQAPAEVQSVATYTTASNEQHGVAVGLDFILRQKGS